MGAIYASDVAANVSLVTTAETVVATLSGVSSQRAGQLVELTGEVNVTGGTTTSAFVLRIREDSLTGTLVDEIATDTLASTVGNAEDHSISAEHAPAGELSLKTYVLTVQQTGATANGTVNHARLRADLVP